VDVRYLAYFCTPAIMIVLLFIALLKSFTSQSNEILLRYLLHASCPSLSSPLFSPPLSSLPSPLSLLSSPLHSSLLFPSLLFPSLLSLLFRVQLNSMQESDKAKAKAKAKISATATAKRPKVTHTQTQTQATSTRSPHNSSPKPSSITGEHIMNRERVGD
jgi:hypothetical protein